MRGPNTPQRIVCLQPSVTVILARIGALGRVVACTRYCVDVVPELNSAPRMVIADSWTAKAEEILQAHPDLVIAAVPYQEESVAQILKAGVRFLGLAPRTLDDIYIDIATIASCAGASEKGELLISAMQTELANMRRATAGLPRKRVFCEEWGKPIIASQPWVQQLVEAAGGQFLGAPGQQITAEEVCRLDPEVVIAAWCGAGNRVPLEKIVRERAWLNTAAARASQVYCISDELLNTPAPTVMEGLQALAAAIHPEHFKNPQAFRNGIRKIQTALPV